MKQPPSDRPVDDAFLIVTQIRRIVRAIHLHSQRLSRSIGLTVPQLVLLQAIEDSPPQEATASRLREGIGVNAATMSGLVDRLVRRGFLERQRSESDRRVVLLRLTETGRSALERTPSPLQAQVLASLSALPDEERTAILSSLQYIVHLMEAESLDASPILTPEDPLGAP